MKHHHVAHCHDLLGQINAYIDGELDPSLCALLETHLETCQNCRIVFNTLTKTIQLCHSDGELTTLPPDIRQRLFASLGLEDDDNLSG